MAASPAHWPQHHDATTSQRTNAETCYKYYVYPNHQSRSNVIFSPNVIQIFHRTPNLFLQILSTKPNSPIFSAYRGPILQTFLPLAINCGKWGVHMKLLRYNSTWLLLAFTSDFLGRVSLSLARGLVTSYYGLKAVQCWMGHCQTLNGWEWWFQKPQMTDLFGRYKCTYRQIIIRSNLLSNEANLFWGKLIK